MKAQNLAYLCHWGLGIKRKGHHKSMRILIIEDDKNLVEAISIAFQMRWPEAKLIATSTGDKGIEIIGGETIDLVILDLGLPDMSGFEVLKQVRLFSNIPVIILTVMSDEYSIIKGLELGADDYLVKPISQLELLARVKSHIRRQTAIVQSPLICGQLHLEPSTAQVHYGTREVHLTPTEYRILYCLMKHAGNLVSNLDLIEQVWSHDSPGANEAIKVHIRHLREKIEVDPGRPKIIITKSGIGHYIAKKE